MTKQPKALQLADEARDAQLDPMLAAHAEVSKVFLLHVEVELSRLHALCEEQKRLLERARAWVPNELWGEITDHLRQHEGEKK